MGHETKREFCRVGGPASAGCSLATPGRSLPRRGTEGGRVLEFGGALVAGIPAHREAGPPAETCARPAAPVTRGAEERVGKVDVARTAGGGILHRRVDAEAHRGTDPQAFRRTLPSRACLEVVAGRSGVELPKARAAGERTRRRWHRALEALQVAAYKKRHTDLVPIWPFWMKAASCSFPTSARRGHRGDEHHGSVIATDTTASRPFRSLPSRRGVSGSDCLFTFTLPTSRPRRSSSSCVLCFDTSVAPSCCSGMADQSTGTLPSRHSCVRIRVCTRNGFPRTPRNSIPMSSSGAKPSANWQTPQRRTSVTSAVAWRRASDGYEDLRLSWLHAFLPQNCHGRERIHYLYEAQ